MKNIFYVTKNLNQKEFFQSTKVEIIIIIRFGVIRAGQSFFFLLLNIPGTECHFL